MGPTGPTATYASRYGSEFPLPNTRSGDIVQPMSPAAGNFPCCDNIGTAAPSPREAHEGLHPGLAGEPIAIATAGPTRVTRTSGVRKGDLRNPGRERVRHLQYKCGADWAGYGAADVARPPTAFKLAIRVPAPERFRVAEVGGQGGLVGERRRPSLGRRGQTGQVVGQRGGVRVTRPARLLVAQGEVQRTSERVTGAAEGGGGY